MNQPISSIDLCKMDVSVGDKLRILIEWAPADNGIYIVRTIEPLGDDCVRCHLDPFTEEPS